MKKKKKSTTKRAPSPARAQLNKATKRLRVGRHVIDTRPAPAVGLLFQLERVECGKPKCKCAAGALHGPYWYVYWRGKNYRRRSGYIGKELYSAKARARIRKLTGKRIDEKRLAHVTRTMQ